MSRYRKIAQESTTSDLNEASSREGADSPGSARAKGTIDTELGNIEARLRSPATEDCAGSAGVGSSPGPGAALDKEVPATPTPPGGPGAEVPPVETATGPLPELGSSSG